MNTNEKFLRFASVVLLVFAFVFAQSLSPVAAAPQGQAKILASTDINAHLFPTVVFFHGQTATSQMDNSGGLKFSDGLLVLAALVDNSGYSTQIRMKYQGYLLTELPIEIGGQTLKPGAYGFGFLDNNVFTVMDVGANDVLTATSTRDAAISHPVPLQFVATPDGANYRLYHGRDYVELHRAR